MTRKPPNPPEEGVWTRAIASVNAETEARAEAAGVAPVGGAGVPHAGRQHPDLWAKLVGLLDDLDGEAAARLDAALRDPLASEELVGALEAWKATNGALATARDHYGIKQGAVATRLRETREGVPDETALADLIAGLALDGAEIEGQPGAPRAHELSDAAREYAAAARRLRAALARAEKAAPRAKARQPDPAKPARHRLAADLCRALGGEIDGANAAVFAAVWRNVTKDNADNPDPPNMQATRTHLHALKKNGRL